MPTILICLCIVSIIAICVITGLQIHKQKTQALIKQNSTRYKAFLELNEQINNRRPRFNQRPNVGIHYRRNGVMVIETHHECKSKRQFDNMDAEKIAGSYIDQNHNYLVKCLSIKNAEKTLETQYYSKLDQIRRLPDYEKLSEIHQKRVTQKRYDKYIRELIQAQSLNFTTTLQFVLIYSYTSPKGRNHYSDYRIFHENEIRSLLTQNNLKIINDNSGHISEGFKQKQRSLMTNKMRYKILQRDNNRCVLCGRTAKESIAISGHGLEIDHIIPVSKGGKTIESNLRTLCFACNRGKGADIEDTA